MEELPTITFAATGILGSFIIIIMIITAARWLLIITAILAIINAVAYSLMKKK